MCDLCGGVGRVCVPSSYVPVGKNGKPLDGVSENFKVCECAKVKKFCELNKRYVMDFKGSLLYRKFISEEDVGMDTSDIVTRCREFCLAVNTQHKPYIIINRAFSEALGMYMMYLTGGRAGDHQNDATIVTANDLFRAFKAKDRAEGAEDLNIECNKTTLLNKPALFLATEPQGTRMLGDPGEAFREIITSRVKGCVTFLKLDSLDYTYLKKLAEFDWLDEQRYTQFESQASFMGAKKTASETPALKTKIN